MLFPKQHRIRDRVHLDWLRALPCCKCVSELSINSNALIHRNLESEPSHIRLNSRSGTGLKPSDDRAIPLCHVHHFESHMGECTFFGDKLDIAIKLASKLYDVTGNDEAARYFIGLAKL